MSEENNDGRFNLSRRKALAGIGSIGAATALGGVGTYAQFTDTENESYTFTAGGIDGLVEGGARYNGQTIDDFAGDFNAQGSLENVSGFDESGALGLDFNLTDVKPGDHGCFSFRIEVTNNPAWVAACIGYKNDKDWLNFEPEVEADPDNITENVDPEDGELEDNATPSQEPGELAESILTIPFYKPPDSDPSDGKNKFDPCIFYDEGDGTYDAENYEGKNAVATPSQFWSNAEDGLKPARLADVATYNMVDTTVWGDSGVSDADTYTLSESIAVDDGCVFLNGAADQGDANQQDANPLQPGTDLYFGWDWHMPFDVGNRAQGDQLDLQLGFVFGQTRHTAEDATLSNVFDPQSQAPNGGPDDV